MTDEGLDWRAGRITDEGVAEMQAVVGRQHVKLEGWNHVVSADGVWHFALGVGDDNPLWSDPDYAARSPYGEIIAPPCYLYSHMFGPRMDPDVTGRTSIETFLPGVMGLMGSERWVFHRPAFLGERITAETGLASVEVKTGGKFGGRSVTQVDRAVLEGAGGDLVAECFTTILRFEREQTRANQAYINRPLANYSQDDRDRIDRQYAAEPAQRRGAEPRYVEDVAVGDPVGPILKGPLTVSILMAFRAGVGCANSLGNRLHARQLRLFPAATMIHPETGVAENFGAPHWDAAMARLSGLPAGFDMGIQRISWLQHLLSDWGGDHAWIAELEMKLLKPMLMGDLGWLRGKVTAVDGAEVTVSMEAVNQLDEVFSVAKARVILPRKTDLTSHLKRRKDTAAHVD